MEFKITIDEEIIKELVSQEIARQVLSGSNYADRTAKYGVREGIDKAVKAYIYKEKDNIIERVVERASVEIVKKGMPKFIDKMFKEE